MGPCQRPQTHALSNSCSLSVFPTASGFDKGSRSAKRLNQAVRSEAGLAGSGERRAEVSTPRSKGPPPPRCLRGPGSPWKGWLLSQTKPMALHLRPRREFQGPLLAGCHISQPRPAARQRPLLVKPHPSGCPQPTQLSKTPGPATSPPAGDRQQLFPKSGCVAEEARCLPGSPQRSHSQPAGSREIPVATPRTSKPQAGKGAGAQAWTLRVTAFFNALPAGRGGPSTRPQAPSGL